jgi:ABC-type uncharacterized transport system involved in gliding motility auxiliary subunit
MPNRSINTTVSLLVLLGIFIFGNIVVSKLPLKLDITEEKLYTLSEGSVNIVSSLDAPLDIKLFFSDSIDGIPPLLKAYNQRVKALLEELASYNDFVQVEFVDPQPDSDEELLAQRFGISGQPSRDGNFYFGVVLSNFNGEKIIPYLDFQKSESLEYDLVRNVYLLANTVKPKIGIISSQEVIGVEPPPMNFGMPQPPAQPGWLFTKELKQSYELEKVDPSSGSIPNDVDLLLVVHAKDLDDKGRYAIDQFVLSGKNAVFFVDPFLMRENENQSQFQPPTPNTALDDLFKKWGVVYSPSKVTMDTTFAYIQRTQAGGQKYPPVMRLTQDAVSKDDMSTSHLSHLFMVYAGHLDVDSGLDKVEFTPLVSTSDKGWSEDKIKMMYTTPQQMVAATPDKGSVLNLAGLYSGTFASAFEASPEGAEGGEHLSASSKTSHIVVVADVDMLEDQYWAQTFNFLGQQMIQARNQNTVLLNNLLEKMSGNDDLISLRSRSRFLRPFDKVIEREEAAREQYQEKETELQEQVQELEEKISQLVQKADPGQKVVISTEIQDKIKSFREEKVKVSRELRHVRKNLRQSIDELGTNLKAINIIFIPLLIALYGIFVAIQKSRRIKA